MVQIDVGSPTITIVVGIDGPVPSPDALDNLREIASVQFNDALDFDVSRDTVTLTTDERITDDQRRILGPRVQHIQFYDVDMDGVEVDMDVIHGVHNQIVNILNNHDFNITGTATIFDEEMYV